MNTKKVLDNYCMIANISHEEALKQYPLVDLAISKVNSWLKEGVEEKNDDILSMLASSLINLWASMAAASSSPTGEWSGNGYTIKKDSNVEINTALELFNRWKSECSHLLNDNDFIFMKTDGKKKEEDDESKS